MKIHVCWQWIDGYSLLPPEWRVAHIVTCIQHVYWLATSGGRVPVVADLHLVSTIRHVLHHKSGHFVKGNKRNTLKNDWSNFLPERQKECYFTNLPAGIWCQNDVVLTSMRRHVASTLIRRHFGTKCPLGYPHANTLAFSGNDNFSNAHNIFLLFCSLSLSLSLSLCDII